jgi:hypothetical protein
MSPKSIRVLRKSNESSQTPQGAAASAGRSAEKLAFDFSRMRLDLGGVQTPFIGAHWSAKLILSEFF